jgi:hypothetical protein
VITLLIVITLVIIKLMSDLSLSSYILRAYANTLRPRLHSMDRWDWGK